MLSTGLQKKMETSDDIAQICADLLDECLSRGSHDNMSAMIVQMTSGEVYTTEKPQYIPGPWFAGERDAKFQSAYAADALAAGYTLEQAHEMRKKIEEANAAATNNTESA